MKLPQLKRPSPATAISILALVAATGGTSYAAATIGTSDIERGAVTSSKIQDETIRSKDIRDGRIRGKDVAPGVRNQTSRWVLVNAAGQIEDQSGGFTLVAGYLVLTNTAPTGQPDNSLRANGNVYINAGENIDDNGLAATIVLQNTVNQGGGPGMAGRDPGTGRQPGVLRRDLGQPMQHR